MCKRQCNTITGAIKLQNASTISATVSVTRLPTPLLQYLLDQFIKPKPNNRSGEYGGSIEKRCRFPIEVVKAVGEVVSFDRVGIR